jgi:hypothetical protein
MADTAVLDSAGTRYRRDLADTFRTDCADKVATANNIIQAAMLQIEEAARLLDEMDWLSRDKHTATVTRKMSGAELRSYMSKQVKDMFDDQLSGVAREAIDVAG